MFTIFFVGQVIYDRTSQHELICVLPENAFGGGGVTSGPDMNTMQHAYKLMYTT